MATASKFDAKRNEIMAIVESLLSSNEYDVLHTASQELCVPIVNSDGDEGYLVMKFTIPKGSRDGDAYDGYSVAESYTLHLKQKAERAKIDLEKKNKKIANDAKRRSEITK